MGRTEKSAPSKKGRRPFTVVHLGNVSTGAISAEKTARYANKFPQVNFVGIDRIPLAPNKPNWRQIEADFLDGLRLLRDGSVDLISSEMSVGYYGRGGSDPRGEYNRQLLSVARKKLVSGGKIHLAVSAATARELIPSLKKAGFRPAHISCRKLGFGESQFTYWLRDLAGMKATVMHI